MAVPTDLILVGYIAGAYGLQGWVKVRPYSADAAALSYAKTWWLDKPDMRDVDVMQTKIHNGEIVAKLVGVAERDAAERLKGAAVQIARSHFPPLSDDEFYWVDLIGLTVENLLGEQLGVVSDLMENAAHPILRVKTSEVDAAGKITAREILIPFVDQFIQTVDQQAKKITVDWERDAV